MTTKNTHKDAYGRRPERTPARTPAPQAATPSPEQDERAMFERAAKAIYWLFPGAEMHPWIDGGNSEKQDEARRYARAALWTTQQAAPEAPASERQAILVANEEGIELAIERQDDGKWQFMPTGFDGARPRLNTAATTASASGIVPAQEFLNWNRQQVTSLVAIGKEMGVFRKAMEFADRAPAPSREAAPLRAALENLLRRYVELVASGDAGNWDAETEDEVIAARAAIAQQATPSAELDAEGLPPLPEPVREVAVSVAGRTLIEKAAKDYFTAEQYRQGQREAIAFDRARRAGSTTGDAWKLEAERDFLEEWIRFATEPIGLECCGRGDGFECCMNPEPVTTRPADWLKSMQERHAEVIKLLAATTSPQPPVGDSQ